VLMLAAPRWCSRSPISFSSSSQIIPDWFLIRVHARKVVSPFFPSPPLFLTLPRVPSLTFGVQANAYTSPFFLLRCSAAVNLLPLLLSPLEAGSPFLFSLRQLEHELSSLSSFSNLFCRSLFLPPLTLVLLLRSSSSFFFFFYKARTRKPVLFSPPTMV